MSKSELVNRDSASEDENSGTEDEYLSDFTKLQPYIYDLVFQKSPWNKTSQEKNISFRRRR